MFHWFGLHQMLVLPFALWLFVAIAIMPKFIRNQQVLSLTVLVIGAVLAWVASLASPFPWTISENMLFAIFAVGGALLHSEIIFRRANGYWHFLGPPRSV